MILFSLTYQIPFPLERRLLSEQFLVALLKLCFNLGDQDLSYRFRRQQFRIILVHGLM